MNENDFQESPLANSRVSFIEPTMMMSYEPSDHPNLPVTEDVIETPANAPTIIVEDERYMDNRRQSLDDGLILGLRGKRLSSGDSGIDKITSGIRPEAVRRLTGSFIEGSHSFTSLPSTVLAEKRRNALQGNRNRTLTNPILAATKSLPGTPRLSIDLGFLNGSNNLSKRRNTTASMFFDGSGSVFDDEGTSEEDKKKHIKKNLTKMFSGIYAVLVVVVGCVLYVASQSQIDNLFSEVFNMVIILLGMFWLMFLQIDLNRYKRFVIERLRIHHENMADNISTTTETVCNQFCFPDDVKPSYFFLRGRHSGSFYLKAGMAAFCFGHLINNGLQLSQQVVYFMDEDKEKLMCAHASTIVLHVLKITYSFYQLFIVFKYSNIIINRCKEIARFGLMHCIATCICFWFNTIVEDALMHYRHSSDASHKNTTTLATGNITSMTFWPDGDVNRPTPMECAKGTIFSSDNLEAIPYLYPFTIEYNLLLAGVWLIVWQNIGNMDAKADPHHFEHKVSYEQNEMTFQSNLVISADCHSANKGLFAGIFLLFVIIISVIVYFVTINHEGSESVGILLYSLQEITLSVLSLGGILYAFKQLITLDINTHPVTFLDDVLLFIPLPFFFVNSILSSMAEVHVGNYIRVAVHILVSLQVLIQTPFIIDGLRRCSNANHLRYKKPGREVVTFLIILNLSVWIVNTFEQKNAETFLANQNVFGDLVSVFIGHITHPLMLFYRFHSSVCLADIWKSAYEKGDH